MVLTCILFAVLLACALHWGPGHHLEFEHRVWRNRRRIPEARRALIEANREAYQYGHIAADIINFKAAGGPYSHCHRWGIIDEMRALSDSDRDEAFVLGYLSHLAADTIAHNHFVPYHLARFARTKGLGHLYWEMNADRFVPEERWRVVTKLKGMPALTELDELVNRTVPTKALPMGTNKLLFNHVLLVSERERWRRGISRLHPIGNLQLKKGFLRVFQNAAVARILLTLQTGTPHALAHVDANGKRAQAKAMQSRKGVLNRLRPGRVRAEKSLERAAPFLEGMQSPPPPPPREATPAEPAVQGTKNGSGRTQSMRR